MQLLRHITEYLQYSSQSRAHTNSDMARPGRSDPRGLDASERGPARGRRALSSRRDPTGERISHSDAPTGMPFSDKEKLSFS